MIAISRARKAFDGKQVLDDVTLEVQPRTICAIVGPTACGKSTLLNLVSRICPPDSGTIQTPNEAGIGYMMQDALLLPWRTLEENATLGSEVVLGQKPPPVEVEAYLKAFDLWQDKGKYPLAASGGMKQRVALVRTLMVASTVLLLDEPFSSLDFDIKLKVQRLLLSHHKRSGTTILWVTHDIEDAIAISDQVLVLSDKPTAVKARLTIQLGLSKPNPVEARKSPKFRDYFVQIWDQLKYLEDNHGD
jgi:NitT/TauT family transport system ATP-binding protein